MAAVYLSLLGKQGIREVAAQNLAKAEYAKAAHRRSARFLPPLLPARPSTSSSSRREEGADAALARLEQRGILGGIPLARFYGDMPGRFLVCVTEQNTREEIDALAAALAGRRP